MEKEAISTLTYGESLSGSIAFLDRFLTGKVNGSVKKYENAILVSPSS